MPEPRRYLSRGQLERACRWAGLVLGTAIVVSRLMRMAEDLAHGRRLAAVLWDLFFTLVLAAVVVRGGYLLWAAYRTRARDAPDPASAGPEV